MAVGRRLNQHGHRDGARCGAGHCSADPTATLHRSDDHCVACLTTSRHRRASRHCAAGHCSADPTAAGHCSADPNAAGHCSADPNATLHPRACRRCGACQTEHPCQWLSHPSPAGAPSQSACPPWRVVGRRRFPWAPSSSAHPCGHHHSWAGALTSQSILSDVPGEMTKATRRWPLSKKCPAASYSPTQSPAQYHRR